MSNQNQEQQQQIQQLQIPQQEQQPLETVQVNIGSFAAKYRSKRGRYSAIFFYSLLLPC